MSRVTRSSSSLHRPSRVSPWLIAGLAGALAFGAPETVLAQEPGPDSTPRDETVVQDAAPRQSGSPLAQDPIVSHLIWRAVDAADDDFEGELEALLDVPELDWRVAVEVLRRGRRHDPEFGGVQAVTDPEAFQAYFDRLRLRSDLVEIHPLGAEDVPYWYGCRLPAGYDGKTPLAVWLELGGLYVGRHEHPLPDDWAVVELNPLLVSSPELGGAPFSMTAGRAAQSVVLSVIADLERRFPVDRDRLFVGGYSRFGNAAWYLGAHWPDRFAGIVPAAGYYPPAEDVIDNFGALAVFAAAGTDRGHRDANAFTRRVGLALAKSAPTRCVAYRAEDRALGTELDRAVIEWAGPIRRDPLPDRFRYELTEPVHRGAYWAAIDEVRDPGKSRFVEIRSLSRTTPETIEFLGRPARLDVERVDRSTIRVRTRNVKSFTLRLSDTQFDLDAEIEIERDGKRRRYRARPSVRTVLLGFRQHRDDRRVFAAELRL